MFKRFGLFAFFLNIFITVLFPNTSIGNESLVKVGVFECPPFVIENDNGSYSGLGMYLLDELSEQNGLSYIPSAYDLEGLLHAVSNGEVDIGVTCLSITPGRETILDFSHSFYETHLAIAVKKQGYFTFLKNLITNKELLIFLFVVCGSAVVIGSIYYFLEHRINDKLYSNTSSGRKLTEGFLLGLLFITKGPFNYYEFKTLAGRALTVLLAVATTFFIASITAVLASSFTLGSLNTDIKSPWDLARKKVGTIEGSTASALLASHNVNHLVYHSIEELFEALDGGELEAVLSDDAVLRYYLKKAKTKDTYVDLTVLPYQFSKQNYGFALMDDSPHIEELNQKLLQIRESREWQQELMKYLVE